MQRDPGFFHGRVPSAGCGATAATPPFGAAVTGTNHDYRPGPLDRLEFQPSKICPHNFIIFDQTENTSRVMFHPALAPKFSYPYDFNDCVDNACKGGKTPEKNDDDDDDDDICSHNEEIADIDALLSSEEDEEDVDTVSTGRSPANRKGSPPYSSSSSEDEEWNSSSNKSFSSGASSSNDDGRKRARVRKMVKALRGIIPGGDSMDTPAVLDEAVKYLKSLKGRVKKLGVQNFENYC